MTKPRTAYDNALLVAVGTEVRKARGALTQTQVATAAGLHLGTVQAVERGDCRQADAYHRVALALEILRHPLQVEMVRAHTDACDALGINPATAPTEANG